MAKFNVFLAGFLAGAAFSLIYAPRKGSETRRMLTRPAKVTIEEVRQYIKENSPTRQGKKV
jgi:gas vesicle protein